MIGLIGKLLGREDAAATDAERVYRVLMDQSRQLEFYGEARVPDSFQGRTELLMLHVSVVMKACLRHGADGKTLQDAIFQRMRDDFDVALREVGYSDAGVKHRIKPLMKLFYQFIQQVYASLEADGPNWSDTFESADEVEGLGHSPAVYQSKLGAYAESFWARVQPLSLDDIARADFGFPEAP